MSVERVGVVGAGTMGAGIAQIAALGGYETRLHDPVPAALETGIERLRSALAKGAREGAVERGGRRRGERPGRRRGKSRRPRRMRPRRRGGAGGPAS